MSFEASFKALSDPVRREILQMLKDRRLSAGEISRHFDMTAATVSYHLNILKKAGLVWEEKEKNFIYYDLNTSILEELMSWLIELEGSRKNEE
ncbi:autorepressor SdpR family transcription factor [Tetragenococcus halophilus]|uniref:autorepressor SdpR family transcription factor n=1 Tax=Tetragenococcus halophilus TaxID=51669 RepID=UPI002569716C|nr:autorepressor SdpR family transcription factor [Tetragenococcus halophilus]GMG62498.1 autorepressor SdpR family transcription factor [Tetragenococcus halophilus]